jgi:hypothetical protein
MVDSAKLYGESDANFPIVRNIPTGVDNKGNTIYTIETVIAVAAGQLNGQLSANSNIFSSATVRLNGSTDIQFSEYVNDEIVYEVFGFKQAEATS